MTVIAIEEHWNLPELTSAVQGATRRPRRRERRARRTGRQPRAARRHRRGPDRGDGRPGHRRADPLARPARHAAARPGRRRCRSASGPTTSPPRPCDDTPRGSGRSRPCPWPTRGGPPPNSNARPVSASSAPWSTGAPARPRSTTRATTTCSPRPPRWVSPIFIHPQIPPRAIREGVLHRFRPADDLALATFGWGWHLEAALAALRLIVRGTFDRHPDLQLVLGHWGELLLFWHDRTDSLSRIAGLERKVSEYVRSNVHITSSGMLNPTLLRHALEVTTPDRLLFSTDYPFQRPSKADIDRFGTAVPHRRGPRAVHGGQRASAFRHHELSSWDRAKLSVSPRAPPIHTSWHASAISASPSVMVPKTLPGTQPWSPLMSRLLRP